MLLGKIDKVKKRFGDKLILDIDNLEIYEGERIGLVGVNGSGKSTLINILVGNINAYEGNSFIDKSYSYINQFDESIEIENSKIFKELCSQSEYNEYLSGGEKVRVALCKVILSDNNLLILDEPTNYLDISSMQVLEEALINTNKSLIIVSHDRAFINKVCNEILVIENKRLVHHSYDLKEMEERKSKPKVNKLEKEKRYKELIIKNRITEVISLLSIEQCREKKEYLESQYKKLLEELKVLK